MRLKEKRQTRVLWAAIGIIALGTPILNGCGGGSDGGATPTPTASATPTPPPGATTGRVRVQLQWPARNAARAVPTYADSVIARLLPPSSDTPLQTVTATRPAGDASSLQTIEFPDAAQIGAYRIGVNAYIGGEGKGAAVAAGVIPVTIIPGGVVEPRVELDSTIQGIAVTPARSVIRLGEATPLYLHLTTADGSELLLPPGTISWSVVVGQGATLQTNPADNTATLTLTTPGTVRVHAQEAQAGRIGAAEVTAIPLAGLRILAPASGGAERRAGFPLNLSAEYTDTQGRPYKYPMGALSWSIVSGGAAATIADNGVLNAGADGAVRVRVTESSFGLSAEADFTFEALGNGVDVNVQ